MTPRALSTYRILRTLNLPSTVLRKITIAADGKPFFAALTDDEFDVVLREIRRVYPQTANVVWQVMDDENTPSGTLRLTPALHGRGWE